MKKAQKVCNYYALAIRLNDALRKGIVDVCVTKERMQSVSEHVYGTLNLAIAIYFTYKPNINLERVLYMLSIHEVDEIILGDTAMTDPNYQNVKENSYKYVKKVLSFIDDDEEILNLIQEFDVGKTKEARFAYLCDKLECDLYIKVMSEKGYFDLETLKEKDNHFSKKIQTGKETLAEIWFPGDAELFEGSEVFKEIFNYAKDNEIIPDIDD